VGSNAFCSSLAAWAAKKAAAKSSGSSSVMFYQVRMAARADGLAG
jgi:hypothetical protein